MGKAAVFSIATSKKAAGRLEFLSSRGMKGLKAVRDTRPGKAGSANSSPGDGELPDKGMLPEMGEAGQALPLGAVAVPGEVSLAIGAGQILVQIAGQNLGAQQTAAGRRLDGQMAVVVYGPLMGAAVDFPVREAAVAAQADAAGADAAQRKHDFPGAGAGMTRSAG